MARKGRTSQMSEIDIPEYLRDPEPIAIDSRTPMNYESVDPKFELRQGYEGDAGFDLAATEDWKVDVHEYSLIPCGVKIELPEGIFGWIVARSSTMRRWGLIVLPGIIDTGFRGELFASVYNPQSTSTRIRKGDRVAQIVPLPNVAAQLEPVRVTKIQGDSARGSNGFGSTGRQ